MNARVVVVGAGAFGGWTALMLRRSGADVTLVDAARTNPRIHAIVLRAYTGSQNELAALLAQACPEAAPAACRNVAYGILTIALGNVFMADIEVSSQRTAVARQSAELLVATLSETLSPRAG